MSVTPVASELVEYARDLFAPEDHSLQRLTQAARERGIPAWEISPDVGRLLQVLCRAVGAKRVLEFGTLAGHSALWLARALPGNGQVVSLEMNPEYAAFAREQLARTEIGHKVEIRVGAALDLLPALAKEVHERGERYDVVFLDADKEHYPEFLTWVVTVLRPNGLLIADNVLHSLSWNATLLDPATQDARILAVREFNRRLASDPCFTSIIIPMREGVAAAVYHP